ncbi:hypothetical protein K9L97_00105 [Candidatus Woesearchaeota archaeon]|nr:hypothetical protein [Candidatus Woesearchaeota archaeon]
MKIHQYIHYTNNLKEIKYKKTILLDTCFIIYELKQGKEKKLENFLKNHEAYITSFNAEELEKITKHKPEIHHALKKLLESDLLKITNIDVKPGQRQKEKEYVQKTEPCLLKIVKDPSDAVLVAAAIKSTSDVLTRDKHHIFKDIVENKLNKYNIKIYNDIHQYENSLTN